MRTADPPGRPPSVPTRPTTELLGLEQGQRLFDELIEVFHDRESAVSLTISAGFPKSRIPYFRTSLEFWSKVLGEACNGAIDGGIQPFVDGAADLYPSNEVFATSRTKPDTGKRARVQQVTPRRIFLSHSTADRPRVRGLVHLLRALGHDTFVASDSIPAGADRDEVVKRALAFCDIVMVLWTRSSSTSESVRNEYLQALTQNPKRPIIPLLADTGIPLPRELSHRQEIILPVIQEILEEKTLLETDGRSPAEIVRMIDDVLDRNQIELPRRQRRDVLIFLCGSGATFGIVALASTVRRGLTSVSTSLKQTCMVAGCVIGLTVSADSLPAPRTHHSRIFADFLHRATTSKRLAYALSVPKGASAEPSPNDETNENGEPTLHSTATVASLDICRGARRAINDLKETVENPRSPRLPDTGASAAQEYVSGVYQDCVVNSQRLGPRPRVEIVCESLLGSPIEALEHASGVSLNFDECTSTSDWSRRIVALPQLSGRTPWQRMATRHGYWKERCGVEVEIYAQECQLLTGFYCSGARAALTGEFWKCLEL